MTAYPLDLERPGLLRDGRSILIRPASPDDADVVLGFNGRLSRRTIAIRSLGPIITMDRDAAVRLVTNDYHDRLVLLATLDDHVIGVADYVRNETAADRADIAFTVEDAYQGMGLGGLLLEHLAAAARERGIEVFEADVVSENLPMIRTFQSSGYRVEFDQEGGITHLELTVDPRRQVLVRSERRASTAIASSLHPVFAPRSVAVVGAGRSARSVGGAVLRNILDGGFTGPVHAVNPNAAQVHGVTTVASVLDIEELDLAIVAVPSADVPQVLDDCAQRDVGAAIVVSTEMDGSGDRGDELLRFARGHGMRVVGPNCMGVISVRHDVRLMATFSPTVPPGGRVAMASQSGPLGLAVLDHAARVGLGFSGFVSLGDSLDVSPNDLLQWWETDRNTGLVLLHLDTFGNARRFSRIARRLAVKKPVIAVHPGAGDDSEAVLGALFTQAGIIRARTMQEMFDTALMLANQPPPPGRRIAILTNAGGPGSLAAGACRAAGLVLAELAEETVRVLADIGRPASNPVDLTPEGDEDDYRVALGALLGDRGVDAVIVLFIPPLVERSAPIAQAIVDAATSVPNKPVLASFLSQEGVVEELRVTPSRSIPSYRFPEAAATALGHAVAYNNWLRMPGGIIRTPKGVSVAEARILVRGFGPGELDADRAKRLLATFGIVADLRDADATPDDGGRGEDQHGESQDVTLRVVDDPIFGPVLALGSASMYAKLYGDIVYRITPLTDRDARMMVESLRSYPILAGTADRPSVDVDALVDLLLRVSALVESVPELGALDARRICVGPPGAGATVTSVHLTLTEPSVARVAREATLETR
ncbi:MAG TPA: GNAT family N-acetyltransferase [Gordonia sp. (in: high G+C Gram-positive bacteria)]|uniref:bifunctional acetate--CoA ligase family protein/GNAT family N-acetyltransferase n=1 Tax=unclassified Gordonia (in: high G+C Gram-positive bacteria) TaxID=2657482 RepID=UPI000F9B034F|nr:MULTISPECIES: GNAT family N-acetyltransferase [unclassified Gordonia (in: high G+C Gram-positive bacteria)]RUP39886.1 MAG: GNAT family N-acetyltransferase [Gordonia sp. (in: high G+C Gram-positive bacteria)]HNP56735.1 GNAT family N-acetyltransferase [Gordonia sp. (in: high G+C Gram-positive bacteria)]HRC51887.1 GNAT family N-acetyltransferase [Gordonia sp. (in: high G+C Gram-positive bacteria)]